MHAVSKNKRLGGTITLKISPAEAAHNISGQIIQYTPVYERLFPFKTGNGYSGNGSAGPDPFAQNDVHDITYIPLLKENVSIPKDNMLQIRGQFPNEVLSQPFKKLCGCNLRNQIFLLIFSICRAHWITPA